MPPMRLEQAAAAAVNDVHVVSGAELRVEKATATKKQLRANCSSHFCLNIILFVLKLNLCTVSPLKSVLCKIYLLKGQWHFSDLCLSWLVGRLVRQWYCKVDPEYPPRVRLLMDGVVHIENMLQSCTVGVRRQIKRPTST